ncbi:MAG: hypothetical protein GWN39_10795, partial [Thermoplasmata archaeon]|nr:hypothetical protein [Thermoplasmata archaeon]NIW89262.1 hypothetical protein [Thermoplasmata archaeon]
MDDDGLLNVEYIEARTAAGMLTADGGQLGVAPGSSGEGIRVFVDAPSVAPLRPFFMGDSLIARDTLQVLEADFLRDFAGIDPDTLPTREEIRFEGALAGELVLSGGLDDLTVRAAL